MKNNEFSLISRYFNRKQKSRLDVETGIGDDCALLDVSEKKILAISTDTLVCGKHFLPNINPSDLAFKSFAVNISDLAAMGADPAWITLALTLPTIDKYWLKTFSNTLFEQLYHYNMQLIGGDLTAGPLSITLAIYGFIPDGYALKRSGAKPNDLIYVTGTLGDSAAGLAILQHRFIINHINDEKYLINRHLRPTPRVFESCKVIRHYASSAIDLSDGLVSDLSHVLKASKVGAYVNLDMLPFSTPIHRHVEPIQAIYWALFGGEDYELCFTVSEINCHILDNMLSAFGIQFTRIGQIIEEKDGMQFIYQGKSVPTEWKEFHSFKDIVTTIK